MSDTATLVDSYIAIWNEADASTRRALISELFTADASFTDPLVDVVGVDAIDQTIAGIQSQFTGLTFRAGELYDSHHDLARFTWELAPGADAEALAIGFDVAKLTADGRIEAIYGFLDKVPSA